MLIPKALFALTMFFSSHAALCMEYDLCQDQDFFKKIKQIRKDKEHDAFCLQSSSDGDTNKSSDSNSLDSDKQLYASPSKRKANLTQPKGKRKKTDLHTYKCPECEQVLSHPSKQTLIKSILIHNHTKMHNPEKYNAAKNYLERNKRVNNQNQKILEISCMHESCEYVMKSDNINRLQKLLIRHLYASDVHNQTEINEVLRYI